MSLNSALSASLSGLSASAKRAEVVSSNIANAQTPGYVRRQVVLVPAGPGAGRVGVHVVSITRPQDHGLLAERRIAGAAAAGAGVTAGFLKTAEAAFGAPGDPASFSARLSALESALINASSQPGNEARLMAVRDALAGAALGLQRATDSVQTARQAADSRIASEVAEVNLALKKVATLNAAIAAGQAGGQDISAQLDQRQALVDRIATIVPLREAPRDQMRIALYTTGGAILLHDSPATLEFESTGVIGAEDTALPGLRLNDRPVQMGEGSVLGGGSLGALFRLRDELAPRAQARLDLLAADLTDRLAATDRHGGLGWLTDAGQPPDLGNSVGLAGRLAVNARLDPAQGGALWRLRDGLSAATPGPLGDGSRLSAQASAMTDARQSGAPLLSPGSRSLLGLAADFLGQTAQSRLAAEAEASFTAARADTLTQAEQENGVDTDAELQDLMAVEKVYGANAKVLKTLDDLMQLLLEV